MFKTGKTRTANVDVRRITRTLSELFWPRSGPGTTPATRSFFSFGGQTSNLASALNDFSKNGAICLKKPGFPAARAGFVREFHGNGMGV